MNTQINNSWEESHKFTPSLVDWTLIFQRSWGLCAKIDKKNFKKIVSYMYELNPFHMITSTPVILV